MEQEELKAVYEDKYETILGMPFEAWLEKGPQTEDQAYARCSEIDRELNRTYDDWFEAQGERKDELGEERERLKAEYDLIEEMFHFEVNDRNW
jgi:hypothetical protein